MNYKEYESRIPKAGILSFINRIPQKVRFLKLVRTYDIYRPPHPEPAYHLGLEEAQENFAYFLKQKVARLICVRNFLSGYGLDIDCNKPDKKSMLSLDAWAYQYWPWFFKKNIWKKYLYSFEFEGIEANIRSILFDLSILLGECYISIRKTSRWYLDSNSEDLAEDRMPSYNRIVIFHDFSEKEAIREAPILDMEAHVYYHYGAQKYTELSKQTDRRMGYILSKPNVEILQQK